jgi:hypothetical protein
MADEISYNGIKPGVYNIDWYTSSQVAIFIGDILIDEVTSMNFVVSQNRRPLYGYADTYFRQMSKGQVIVQGSFTINFKEAGYLWLILDNYKKIMGGTSKLTPWKSSQDQYQQNVEKLVNGEFEPGQRTDAFSTLAEVYASLTGFSSITRAQAALSKNVLGKAEGLFEVFEDKVWGVADKDLLDEHRRADDVDLNPFDIYISYGDFAGDNRANHTIIKLEDVYIVSGGQQIEIDGMPLQERYDFLARTKI